MYLQLAAPAVVLALARATFLVGRARRVLRQAQAIVVVTRVASWTATSVAIAAGDIGKVARPVDASVDRANITVSAVRIYSATTINQAVDLVLASFADAVAAAEGDRRGNLAAIHGAVAGLLARPGAHAVPTTRLAPAAGTTAVRRATDTVLAVPIAHAVSARAASIAPDAIVGAVVAVLARLTDTVIIADLWYAHAPGTNLTQGAGHRIVGAHAAGATVGRTVVTVVAVDLRVRADPAGATVGRAGVTVIAVDRIVEAYAAGATVDRTVVTVIAVDLRVRAGPTGTTVGRAGVTVVTVDRRSRLAGASVASLRAVAGITVIAFGIRSTAGAAIRSGYAECVVADGTAPARDADHVLDARRHADRDLRRTAAAAEVIVAAQHVATRAGTAGVD